MRKILCALSLFSCLSSDAILTIDRYRQHIGNFRSDVDLLKGYVLCDYENILEEHRVYGNFKTGIRGRNSKRGLSYQDRGNDAMTRLVIQLFPSVGGHLNPEGTGSFTNLIMLANENNFSEIDLIVGMFQLAQDVRFQKKEVNLTTDEEITKNLHDIATKGWKESFSGKPYKVQKISDEDIETNAQKLIDGKMDIQELSDDSQVLRQYIKYLKNKNRQDLIRSISQKIANSNKKEYKLFPKISAENYFRYIDLLRDDLKIEQNKKDQIEKRIWKFIENQIRDSSIDWCLRCLKKLSNCKDADMRAIIRNKILRKIADYYFGSIQDKNLFTALSDLVVNIVESIDSENITFKGEVDSEKYPQNYTNYVIAAYAWRILNNNQLETLAEKLQQRLNYVGGNYTSELIKFFMKDFSCFPFRDAQVLPFGRANIFGMAFPDCGENALKNFFAVLLYSIDDNPVNDRLPNTKIGEKIKKFFEGGREKIQEKVLSNDYRSEWATILANIPGIKYNLVSEFDEEFGEYFSDLSTYYRTCTGENNLFFAEIAVGWNNLVKVIAKLLEGYKAGVDDGTEIYKRKYKAQKTIEDINANINENLSYTEDQIEKILNDILGIRTDVKLTAKYDLEQKNLDKGFQVIKISANLSGIATEDVESVFMAAAIDTATFFCEQKKKYISDISETEWIDSLINNRHKATKNYSPISKFTSARHQHLKQKIFPEALARRFLFNQIEIADLMKILKDYTEQEQIEVIKSIYDHAYVWQFLDLFYNPREIVKKILRKIPEESEGKPPAEALLSYYIADSKYSVATAFNDILKKSIQKRDIKEIKSFFEMVSQIYENINLMIDHMSEKDKERPMPQPKGSEVLLDYMLFAIENLTNDDLHALRDQFIMTLDLFDIDHLIGNPKLDNLLKKLQNLYKLEEKTYCLNEYLKRSIEKIRLMSHIARLTYDGDYFLNESDEDESITIMQAKNLFSFTCPDDTLDRINEKEILNNLPVILTNALSIYNFNERSTFPETNYDSLFQQMNYVANTYLRRHISVEKAKSWIDTNPILIHLFNEKNTNISQIFDYFLELLENGTIPKFHLSCFSSFVNSVRENISDEQMKKWFKLSKSNR
jgi:hypothetical protein